MARRGRRNQIGELFIRIFGDSSSFKEDLKEVEEATEQAANKTERQADKMSNAFARLGDRLTKVQAVVSRILIPAAVVSSVAALAAKFRQVAEETERFVRAIESVGRAQQKTLQDEASQLRTVDEFQQARLRIARESLDAQRTINDELETQLDRTANLGGQVQLLIANLFTNNPVSRGGLARAAAAELEKIESSTNQRLTLLQRREEERRFEAARERVDAVFEAQLAAQAKLAEQRRRDDEAEVARFRERLEALQSQFALEQQIARERRKSIEAFERRFGEAIERLEDRLRSTLSLERLVIASERTAKLMEQIARQARGRG